MVKSLLANRPKKLLMVEIFSFLARVLDWIIIRICHTDLKEFPEYTLYNIKNDPHETINLAGKKTEILSHGLRMMDQGCLSK